ncbi:hypothetical protein KY289_031756 [Solanum tuberosum]|nr:hypothetical protein KY289_031756 [Solanum tuberosum]
MEGECAYLTEQRKDKGNSIAYDFLLSNGYINFGVSPSFVSNLPEEPSEVSVIIVGAGLAGLAAARQLKSFGFKVSILEGRHRPGGRVYTEKMGWKGKFAAVDLGGSVITGIHANPLGVLARQLSIPLHKVRDKCPLYKPDGAPVDAVFDSRVELIFNKLLDKVTELRKIVSGLANDVSLGSVLEKLRRIYTVAKTKEEKQLLHWHFANLEYANAGCISELSAAYWDQDDPYEMDGDHCFLAGGNWGMIRALCKGVPIFYGKTVQIIKYGNEGVEVVAGDQLFQADMVLCTVPLGVLKRRLIRFEPELPEKKLEAIDRLGFGLLNKVALVFPHVFWGEDLDTFGCLNHYSHRRGEYFLFYSYHTVSGGPVLIALVAGDAAQFFESTEPSTLINRGWCPGQLTRTSTNPPISLSRKNLKSGFDFHLATSTGIYEPKGISVPDPIQSICTKCGSDPFSCGSYSHIRVQSSGSDYDILAENLGGRLFFAGEATIRQHPATMHGAYLSGLREASHISQSMKARQNNPRKTISKNVRPSNDVLKELFKKPDLAFGKFLFVFDPLTCDSKYLGLMRVTFGKSNNEFNTEEVANMPPHLLNPSLQLYTVVSREQARELQLVKEGNNCKLSDLLKGLGLKLVGANGLRVQGHSLAAKIVNARKGRKRSRSCTAKQKPGNSNSQLP